MNPAASLILRAVRDPSSTADLSGQDWDLLLRLARRTSLLAFVAVGLKDADALDSVPARARSALQSALNEVAKLQQMGSWEINRIARALRASGIRLVLLKGMAYWQAGVPHARGRPFSDVDVLVPRERLEEAERLLKQADWVSVKTDEYDQHYYRAWMHELAPLRHSEREAIVDLHHAIVPVTSRLKMDSERLLENTRGVTDSALETLHPTDMLIHAAVHLFHDGDLGDCLRDLVDVDQLFRHFVAEEAGFQNQLLERAAALGAGRTLYYALRYARTLLGTPVPDGAFAELARYKPSAPVLKLMDLTVPLALLPQHPDEPSRLAGFARWCLYVRSHFLRMPFRLLIPHLLRKGRRRQKTYFELIGAER